MTNNKSGGGAFGTGPLDAGPEQGGSNMGGLGSTGAIDRDRDPEAEGYEPRKPVPSSAREHAIIAQAKKSEAKDQADKDAEEKARTTGSRQSEKADRN